MGGSDPKRSINAAEMEASLRKAARVQARKERQEKLEELKAKGVLVQTAEDREREQQEVEDLLERARQEAVEIQKREKALAKKEGNYSKDELDDDDSDDDEDFEDDDEGQVSEDSDNDEDDGEEDEVEGDESGLLDNEADENDSDESSSPGSPLGDMMLGAAHGLEPGRQASSNMTRKARVNRVLSDDEEEEEERPKDQPQSPQLPVPAKTPQSLSRSARKQIPGLQMSDDLPIGLTQAFAATMADSQSQDLTQGLQEQDSLTMTMDLPSPNIAMVPRLQRLDSIDVITNSQPDSQTQPLDINLSFSQSQRIPQSPRQFTPSQPQFEPTQDAGYILSPFAGNRFATDTPQHAAPHSTIDTLVLPRETQDSPVMQRKSRLRRGHERTIDSDEEELTEAAGASAFDVMRRAAKRKPQELFDKSKSHARDIVDEAAEESEDEYAGLGGASDEDVNDEENEDDRRMIDEDTEVGAGDASKLAKLFADRERQRDEADVSKLYKDLTTGALRRKRGNDDLDLSDEEDAAVRRREAKRREHAKMRRELFKDEAVGKIAEDRKKEAFLKSIEDRQVSDEEEEDDFDQPETPLEDDSQDKAQSSTELSGLERPEAKSQDVASTSKQPLETVAPSRTNQVRRSIGGRGGKGAASLNRRPATLAEIRESVSFLIEEPDSQAANVDLGLSDSEEEPEAYVDLDRHLQEAEADENAEDGDDLGDFIVDDDTPEEDQTFKKPTIPYSEVKRAPFSERRTKERGDVVDRLQMMRQSSSSSTGGGKMAFHANSVSSSSSFGKVPSLLRRATTNSSLGSNSSVTSATGVVTMRPERGRAGDEKEFVRKSTGSRRNAVNYRPTVAEEKMSQRAGIVKKTTTKKSGGGGFLGAFLGRDNWA
jgi:mediator of replication checkpoint protein 1